MGSETKDSDYSKYMIIQELEEAERKDKLCENVTKIRLVNKDGGTNYASCDGIYIRRDDVVINKCNPYVNKDKDRFIGRTGKGWTLTGMQWFDAIVKESEEKEKKGGHYFGGFHGAINETESVALSKWKEYEVIVCDDTGQQASPRVKTDGVHAFIFWEDKVSTKFVIFTHHFI